ncbi:MAG: hypothetical protein NTX79_05345 [Candidatus Micrarchaeota archaeon]|nr:hypothetical protein [Candidatus Micrarchaeota archaeon]
MIEYLLLTPAELITKSEVMLAFAFAVSIIALSFMAGEFMSMPSLKGFAKAELYELGVSAVILVILLVLITPGGPFDLVGRGFMAPVQLLEPGSPPPPYPGPTLCKEWIALHGTPVLDATGTWSVPNGNIVFGQANYFLGCKPDISVDWNPFNGIPAQSFSGIMTSRLAKGYASLMLTQMFTGLLAGFYTSIEISAFKVLAVSVGITPWVALGPLNQAHTIIVDLIGTTYAAFTAQNMLLKFIEKAALPVFLPFGLMLRAFPFTRKTGSTIISVVVAAYFVFPISILINEQIWIMIAAPECTNGGASVGNACRADADCCSFNCRGGVCSAKVTDFKEYRSIFSICSDPNEIDSTLKTIADEQDNRMLEIYFTGNPSTTVPTKAEGRLQDGLGTLAKQHGTAFLAFTKSLLNPLPGPTAQTVFSQIEVLVVDASQFALLGMIFTVITVVVSLTLLKDFAILIGGEPRIFGLSKLV